MRRSTATGIRHTKPAPAPARTAPDVAKRRARGRWLVAGGVLLAAVAVGLALAGYTFWGGPPPREGMVWVPGGEFDMGDATGRFKDALPVHRVRVDGFYMDTHPVTNAQFARFVEATGYVTIAERPLTEEELAPFLPPGKRLAPEELTPRAPVFRPPAHLTAEECRDGNCNDWWVPTPGACWKHPEGPDSDLRGRENHPVVLVAWEDAKAYADWAGKRLPTEAEFEYAARGGLAKKTYAWGDELHPGGRWMANIWQGPFPLADAAADGHAGTSPVGAYPANGYGLHDMSGNVWQWCADWYQPNYYDASPRDNPQGPAFSIDPSGRNEPKRVQRGGSYLCNDTPNSANRCVRYQVGGRGQGEPKTGLSHTGFRCVWSPK